MCIVCFLFDVSASRERESSRNTPLYSNYSGLDVIAPPTVNMCKQHLGLITGQIYSIQYTEACSCVLFNSSLTLIVDQQFNQTVGKALPTDLFQLIRNDHLHSHISTPQKMSCLRNTNISTFNQSLKINLSFNNNAVQLNMVDMVT